MNTWMEWLTNLLKSKPKNTPRPLHCARCKQRLNPSNTSWQTSLKLKNIIECDSCAGSGAIY